MQTCPKGEKKANYLFYKKKLTFARLNLVEITLPERSCIYFVNTGEKKQISNTSRPLVQFVNK